MNHYSLGGKIYRVNLDNGELNSLIESFYRLHPELHKHIKPGSNYAGTKENKHLAEMLLINVLEYNRNGFYGYLSEVKDQTEREKILLLANVYNDGIMMFPPSPEFERKFPVGSPEFDRKKNKNKKGKK